MAFLRTEASQMMHDRKHYPVSCSLYGLIWRYLGYVGVMTDVTDDGVWGLSLLW